MGFSISDEDFEKCILIDEVVAEDKELVRREKEKAEAFRKKYPHLLNK